MVTAGSLLKIYRHRLGMAGKGVTKMSPSVQDAIERFVEKLKTIAPDEAVVIDADENRDPIARFVRASTGEVIGEFNNPPEFEQNS